MSRFVVENGNLLDNGAFVCDVSTDSQPSPAWVEWLDKNTSFSFKGQQGAFSAVKERRELRSGNRSAYWYAHLRVAGRLHHRSLGSINYLKNITLEKLEMVAGRLARIRLREAAPAADQREWRAAEQRRRKRGRPPAGPLRLLVEAEKIKQIGLFDDQGEQAGKDSYYDAAG